MRERNESILPHTSWGAIFVGTILALGVQFMLSLLGAGLGLIGLDLQDGMNLSAFGWGAGIWFALTFMISLFIGGYSASRLSTNVMRYAGSLNAMVVWALVIGTNLVIAGSGVSSVASVMSTPVKAITDSMNIDISPQEITGIDFQQMESEVEEFLSEIDNEQVADSIKNEYQNLKTSAQQAARQVMMNPAEMENILDDFGQQVQMHLEEISQSVSREDVAEVYAQKTGLDQEQAQQSISRWQAQIESWGKDFQGNLDQAKNQALKQAQEAADTTGMFALSAFFILLLAIFATFFGAVLGSRKTAKQARIHD